VECAAKLGQPAKFLLDLFKTLVSLGVSDLAYHVPFLFTPILLIQFLDFGDFGPETHNLLFEGA